MTAWYLPEYGPTLNFRGRGGRGHFLFVVGVWLLATSSATLGPVSAAGWDPRPAPGIVNGAPAFDFPSVGMLVIRPNGSCSGTLIGCKTFLTAAHCVCEHDGKACRPGEPAAPDPSNYEVFFPDAGFFAVESIQVNPAYKGLVGDFAVVTLETPVTAIRPKAINTTASVPQGASATIVGYGRSSEATQDFGLRRRGQVVVGDCSPETLCWFFDEPVGLPGEDSNTCFGDSGGPVFWDSGSDVVVAATVTGGEGCTAPAGSFGASTYRYRSFIESAAGFDLSQQACGDVPHLGEDAVVVSGFEGELDEVNTFDVHSVEVTPGDIELRVGLTGVDSGAEDFDFYLKHGSPPTTSMFDCAATRTDQLGFCSVSDPGAGTWHILVERVVGAGEYQLSVSVLSDGCTGDNDGSACDDKDSCTDGDVCEAGLCQGTLLPDGASCDDGLGCTSQDSCNAGVCTGVAAPSAGCRAPLLSRKSSLSIRDSSNDARDGLLWKYRNGEASPHADFGDPETSSEFDLCLWDETGGVATLVSQLHLPSGPAWSSRSSRHSYRDKSMSRSGLDKAMLRGSDRDGGTAITVRARGESAPIPALPLAQDGSVVIQLVGETACWEARFSSSKKNETDSFRAVSD